jgi:hypothetical protein
VLGFLILETGKLDPVELPSVEEVCGKILKQVTEKFPETVEGIDREGRLEKTDMQRISEFILSKDV